MNNIANQSHFEIFPTATVEDSFYTNPSYVRGRYEYTILSLTIPAIPGVTSKVSHKLVLEAVYPDTIKGDVENQLKRCLKSSITDGMKVLTLSAVAASPGGAVAMMSAVTTSITPAVNKVRESFIDCTKDIVSLKNISNQIKINIAHKS